MSFVIPGFNSLSCELEQFTLYIESFYTDIILKKNKFSTDISNVCYIKIYRQILHFNT